MQYHDNMKIQQNWEKRNKMCKVCLLSRYMKGKYMKQKMYFVNYNSITSNHNTKSS